MKFYSDDLKIRVVNYYNANIATTNYRDVGIIFGVGKSSVGRWVKYGIIRKIKKLSDKFIEVSKFIIDIINTNPLESLANLKHLINDKFNKIISRQTIWNILVRNGYTMKKVYKEIITSKNTDEIKKQFRDKLKNHDNIITLDEVGFQLDMFKRKGWSKKGQKCRYKTKRTGRVNISGIFLISKDAIVDYILYKGAIKGPIFIDFLKNISKDKIGKKQLVMDNLRIHHMKDVKDFFSQLDTEINYMPPYSPDLNPIEEMFSWIKIKLREIHIKTQTELEDNLKILVKDINSKGLRHYFDHSYH
jgi:transposase